MKNKIKIPGWPHDEPAFPQEQLFPVPPSTHKEYANEGDEYLDDAIRMADQSFEQMDGMFDLWKLRTGNANH